MSYIITKQGIEREGLRYHRIKGNLNQVWKNVVDIKGLVKPSLTKILLWVLQPTDEN